MKGLLLKDFLSLKSFYKTYSIMLILFAVVSVITNNIYIMLGILLFLPPLLITASFSSDASAHTENFLLASAISRKSMVLGKYFFSYLTFILTYILILGISIITSLFLATKVDLLTELFIPSVILLGMNLFINAFLLPLNYKFGAEKARLIFTGLMVASAGIIVFFGNQFTALNLSTDLLNWIPWILLVIVLVANILSYFASLRIVLNKEFN